MRLGTWRVGLSAAATRCRKRNESHLAVSSTPTTRVSLYAVLTPGIQIRRTSNLIISLLPSRLYPLNSNLPRLQCWRILNTYTYYSTRGHRLSQPISFPSLEFERFTGWIDIPLDHEGGGDSGKTNISSQDRRRLSKSQGYTRSRAKGLPSGWAG
jgi:hypothetical protein